MLRALYSFLSNLSKQLRCRESTKLRLIPFGDSMRVDRRILVSANRHKQLTFRLVLCKHILSEKIAYVFIFYEIGVKPTQPNEKERRKIFEIHIGKRRKNDLANIDRALYQANEQMIRTVERHGECFNLDGFIAEQQHVNDFNAQAALENRNYRAYVEEPEIGKGYAKNSFDVVIKDKNGKIIYQYQFKFGKDAAATIRLLKSGNYNNQQLLVPAEQIEEVQKAFPDKTVTDHIGGTDKVPTKSKGLTKAEVKKLQLDAQEKNKIEIADWNSYSVSELTIHLGKNAALTGAISARNAVGFHIAKKILSGEKIEAEEVVEVALKTGVDVGVKTAAAGALKVAVEKGLVPVLVKGTPAGLIANIAAVAVENAKIMAKFARGEIGGIQAMDYIARTTTAAVSGMVTMGEGATIGAALFSVIPVVGTVVGGVIGGAISVVSGVGSAISSFGGWVSSWF